MANKYWWESEEEEEKQGYWWDQNSNSDIANTVGTNITNRVNTWLKNHNNYIKNYQYRYKNRKYSYEDAYVSDSGSWLDTVSKQKSNFDAEADSILAYMDQFSGYLDADWMKSVRDTLTGARGQQSSIVESATKDNEWWGSFGSKDMVKQYGSAEAAYKTHQRYDGYSKKYNGMTSADLGDLLKDLDDGEEKDWLTSHKASVYRDEMLKYDVAGNEENLGKLEQILSQYDNLRQYYDAYQKNPDAYSGSEYENHRTMADIFSQYQQTFGSKKELEKLVHDTRLNINNAKRTQKNAELSSVADSTSKTYDPEFGKYSSYVSDGETPLIPDYKDIAYDAVNGNMDSLGLAAGQSRFGTISTSELQRLDAIRYMDEDEKALYNYYYNKHGYEAAEEYLDSIIDSLNYLHGKKIFAPMENKWLLEELFGIAAGFDQFYSGITSFLSGDDYIPTSAMQYASGMVREDLADTSIPMWYNFKTGKWEDKILGNSLGQGVYDLITTTSNMAPSILTSMAVSTINPAAGAVAGNALMGVSSAGNAYQEALNLGYDKGQARVYSTLVGASEVGLQYLIGGIGKLGGKLSGKAATSLASKFDNAYARLAVKYGTNMLSEGAEEYLQEVLTPVFKNLALGTDEEISLITEDAIYSFLLGAISSGFMEGTGISSENGKGFVGNIRDISSKNQKNIDAVKQYGGSTKELIEEGLKSESGSESRQLAEMMKRKTGRGKEMSGYEIRSLVEANETQFAVEDYDLAVKTAREKLTKLGESKNIDKIAKLVAKRATGQELTAPEKSTLVRSQFGAQVAKEMTRPVVETQSGPKSYNATYKSLEDRVGTESRFGVSESGTATIRESGKEISLANVEVVKTEDGQLTVKLADGQEVYAGDIDFADDTQAYAFSAVADIENITPAAATAIIRDLDLSKPVGAQLNGIDEAYTYGYHGYSEADLKAGQYTSNLTNEQMMSAYKLGQSARKISDVDADAPVVKMRTAAEAKMTAEQKTAQQKKRIESKDVEVYFEDGKSVVKFDEHTGKYDDKRMSAVNTAKFLSKLGIGGKYYFYESYVNADGDRVYKDANGNEAEAPNGMYKDADGSIHIDLNAGNAGQGTALFTMGHELTHFIKAQSKKQFKVLSDLVAEAFNKTEMSMHERVVEKQDFLSEKRGYHVSYNEALEEVVADAMSTMLTDGSFYEKLMEIKVKDKGLFNTIKRFFEKMIAKFKKVYEDLTPDQRDARDIREMKDMFDRIQTAFAEALMEASENFQAAMESVVEAKAEAVSTDEIVTDGAVVTDGNGERFSIRSMKHDIAEGKMFEDLKNVCGWTNTQVNTLKTQLQDLVEYMIPYRNILDMNETYGMEGRRFSPYKPNSDPLYKISMDFSTLCSKRLLTQHVIENLQLRENRPMSAEEQMAIRDMLNEYRKVEKGLQVACAMCYVEAARLKSPKQIQRWLDDPTPHLVNYFALKNTEFNASVKEAQADFKESRGYDRNAPKKDMKPADVKELNKIGPKLRSQYQLSAEEQAIVEQAKTLPNSTYLTAGNLANLSETNPAIYDAYTAFVRTATRSKSLETDEPYYYGDSRRDNGNGIIVSDSFIETVNRENGMRFSSWSDWRIQHLLDYITAVIDNSVRGAAMHGYTKFGDEVRVLGKTGMMFNMSGVAGTQTGLNEDGSLNFSDTESIDVNEAIQLREEFPEHAGLQCIGVGDEHIIALLRSDIIDYVIPYHVSGMNADLRRMADIYGWKDYTGTQHAAIDKSIKLEDAVDKEHWHEEPVFSEFFVGYDTGMTGIEAMRASAEKYKQMCKDRGLTPKFNQFATEDNYWKLLIDRKMINQQTGRLIQQRAVTPTFDFDAIKGVVDKFVDNYDAGLEGRALNHIVKNWDSIPQRIKDLKKQGGTKAKKTAKAVDTLSNQTLAAQPAKNSDRQNKNRASNGSPLTRRSVKQRSVGSTHERMSSTAAAEKLGIENIAKYSDSVKEAIAVLGEFYDSVDTRKPVLGFGKTITASNLEGSLIAQKVLTREGTSGSAYRYDDGHALRISNHSANANNFVGDGEHLSIALFERGKMNDFVEGKSNVIEAVFRKRYLDGNPEVLKQVIHDIAHFIAEGEYHDTAGAMRYNFSGTETFKENARERLAKDEITRGQKFSDRDTAYLDAVSRGDMKTAQRMVDEAAKKTGYPVKAYHGTPIKGITVFDNAKIGTTTDDGLFGHGFYFTTNKSTADGYATVDGETMPVFLRVDKPWWGLGHKIDEVAEELGLSKETLTTRKIGKNSSVVAPLTNYSRTFTSHLIENGYDSVVVQHGRNDYEVVVFDNTRIKSADPVTYDDNGNVIPLSERFNTEKDDIRYSDRDSNGKLLGEDQLEYFEKSMARDRSGRLQVVYHGGTVEYEFDTTRGGKGETQYGPGSYFTDAKGYADEYLYYRGGTTKEYYLNIERMFDDTNMEATAQMPEWKNLEQILRNNGIEEKFIKRFAEDGFAYMSRYLAIKAGAKTSGSWEGSEQLNAMLREAGFDGIKGYLNDAYQYAIFSPNQAKLTTNEVPSTFFDTRYSERGEGTSNRALLANAFEGLSRNSDEYKMIQEYKGRVKLLNEQEEKLARLNAEIREIRFTEGKYDAKKLKMLEAEAKSVAESINRQDKKLLNMEVSEPFRKVIERERKKEAQKTKEHVKEIQQNKKLRAEQTELRHKIRKAVRDLDKLLNRGNKKLNVKEDMKGFASKALELADYLFTDHISNDELIRKGITVRMTPKEAALVTETEDILTKLYDHADSLTDEEFTRLDAKRKANEEKLRDLLTAQRNERLSTPVYQLFDDLVKAYASLKNSSQDAVKAAYDEELEKSLRAFMSDDARVKILENMRVADMTTEELNWLYRAYTMVLNNVRNANKFHVKGMTETIDQKVGRIVSDFGNRKIPDGKVEIVARNLANKIGWDYEKLYYALDRIGSEAFSELIMNLANSENIVMQDVMEATAFRNEIVEKYGFNNWAVNKEIDREFLDNTGKKFKLTLGQMMALYAYSRREGAWDHIEYGGFVFGEAALTNPRPADSYKLSKAQCEAITDLLTKDQKSYVEAMQKYLSETMGAKGNEVSMMLYGIKVFGEKNYFPIHVAGQFKAQAQESQAKAAAGFGSMSNAGFTHAQNPNAKAPFVLEGFNEVWADHVNEMSRYHGSVPALEDIRRVMNRSSYSDAYMESMSVKAVMENAFGKDAVAYFDNLYREANSGAIQDKLQRKSKKLLSLFRKGSVAYSLSVVIQQPSAIKRAYAMIDPKYFGFKGFGALTSGVAKAVTSKWNKSYSDTYNKMLKYAPGVTLAKEIGGFDTHTGTSIREYLLDTSKGFSQKLKTGTVAEKGKAVLDVVDNNAIANLPNVADKIAWMEIWNACERETVAKHKDLTPGSDEFLQTVGDRFTEVIRATQVYDSIFSKSPMLKSKNLAVQYLVSFMNEPNTTANMVEKAVRDAVKGDWKSGFRTAAAVTYSIIFNNVLKSIIYAMRDDDEDETYQEKYIEAMVGNLMSDFNPLSYIPIARDAWSIAQGYDVERADMAIIADAMDALGQVIKNGFTDTEEMTEEQFVEFDKKVTEANWKLVESMAAFFGIPVKNIRREINAVFDHARIASANAGLTTDQSRWDTIYDAVLDSIPFVSGNRSKQDKLYDALVSGDTVYVNRLKSGYKDDDAYHSAVRTALRENDPRIKEAAQAHINGDPSKRVEIAKKIIADLGKDYFNDVITAINSEIEKMTPDGGSSDTKKVKGLYKVEDFVKEAANGDTASLGAIREDILQTAQANGKTESEAQKGFVSDIKSEAKESYISGALDDSTAKKLLTEYADMDEDEAAEKLSYWAFCREHPDTDLNESQVKKFHEFAEPVGISLDVFEQYVKNTTGLSTIYDEWGDEVKSKRDQVVDAIHALPLTWQQKDALYLAAGYAESTLWDVPW